MSLSDAGRLTRILTAIAIGAAVWGLIPTLLPHTNVAIVILAIMPWIGLETVRRSGGAILINQRNRKDSQPNVAVAVVMPGLILAVRAMTDYNVVQSLRVVLLSGAAAALLSMGAFAVDSTARAQTRTMILLVLFSLAYGYGVTIEVNAQFDRSNAETYRVAVQGKHLTRGKSTTCELELGPWGPRANPNTLRVSRRIYEIMQNGDLAELALRPGAFGIRWYVLRHLLRPT